MLSFFTPLVLLITSVLSMAAAASAPAASAATTNTAVSFTCVATGVPVIGTTSLTQALSFSTDAPATVAPNTNFTVSVATDPIVVPSTQSSGGVSATVNKITNVTVRIPIPAGATYISGSLSGGSNYGGAPTLSVVGGNLEMFMPGPLTGGSTVTPPTVTAVLKSGAAPQTLTTAILNSNQGYTLTVNITVLGTTADLATTCDPDEPNPALSTTLTVGPDTTAPTITVTSPASGNTYAQGSSVTVAFACTDPTVVGQENSGVATCVGTQANGAALDTSTVGAHTFTVNSTDVAGNASVSHVTYNVAVPSGNDTTPPTITLTTPPNGATYTVGQVVNADYSCIDDQASGTCAGTVANGAAINTATPGPKTFTVDATDAAGNKASKTTSYYVLVGSGSTVSNNGCPTLANVSGSSNISSSPGTQACVRATAAAPNGGTLTPGSTVQLDYQLYHPTGVGGWNGGMNILNWSINLPANSTLVGGAGGVIVNETGINGETHAGAYSCSAFTGMTTPATATATQVVISAYDANSYAGGIGDIGCTSGDGVLVHVRFSVTINAGATGTFTIKGFPGITGNDPTTFNTAVTSDPISDAQVGIAYHIADLVAPTVTITSPTDGAVVAAGASLNAGFTCADASGLSSCTGLVDGTTAVANGAALPTGAPGSHQLKVTGVDSDGNTAIGYATYDVQKPDVGVTGCTVNEGVGCTFTVTLGHALTVPASVDYTTADGTAAAGVRYTGKTGTLTFSAGQTSKTVGVATIANWGQYPNQDFSLNLSNPVNANLTGFSATGTVVDTSAPPYVIAGLANVSRSSSGGATVELAVNVQNQFGSNIANGLPITVDYTTGDFTAHAGPDYTPVSGTLTFLPGEMTKNIEIVVPPTSVASDPKLLLIGLSNPTNAVLGGLGPGLGLVGITDTNPKVVASVQDVSANIHSGSTGSLVLFNVTLTNTSDQLTSVDYATADGTGVAGTDYKATSGTLLILPGTTVNRHIWVNVKGAAAVGQVRDFTLTLSNPSGPIEIGNAVGTGTITIVP